MKHRRLPCLLVTVALLALAACDQEPDVDTSRDTLADPLGDVVALDGLLYTTNDDRSGNAGSQVDLFEYDPGGAALARHDLGLNHVGYLAATSDGDDIYLQARGTGRLFRTTRLGEVVWTRHDPFSGSDRLACGIAYRADLDSFEVVYRRPGTTGYTTLRYGPGFEGESGEPGEHDWPGFDPDRGALAVAWSGGRLWVLGPDADGSMTIQGFADDGGATRIIELADDSACGLTARGETLWVAYPDRRFEAIPLREGRR